MNRRITALAAAGALAIGAATLAAPASARDSFAFSIGVPGVAFGYSDYPYYTPYYAPAPYAYYYGPTVVYRPYYRPYYHHHYYYGPHRYYRHW